MYAYVIHTVGGKFIDSDVATRVFHCLWKKTTEGKIKFSYCQISLQPVNRHLANCIIHRMLVEVH